MPPSPRPAASPDPGARRRRREAVFGTAALAPGDAEPPLRALTGTVLDASPHLLVLDAGGTEVRLAMSDATRIWRGGRGGLAALRPGRPVVVRQRGAAHAGAPGTGVAAADRVWVEIGRVAGTILACGRDTVEVDMGAHRGRAHVVIPPHALQRILVRHPRLEPGYLFDAICVGSPGEPHAIRPGTSQPGYRVDDLAAPDATAPVPAELRGTATWFGDAGGGAPDGAAYPAVDPEGAAGGCADAPSGCVPFPYLSLGGELTVRNECGGRAATVPVVECGCAAARFCDRCVECGASPRGRIVELTPVAFAALGGDLEAGCFNASVRPHLPPTGEGPW
ncbi:hypothetical protein SAMN05443665_103671 [Actinomadura meyerae]|uniref:Uncharacterized protein n=1 Tax=Actinomadura meyerae TaxID=240840 RepID=A0A239N7X1_9ACTN|nr:hypothetical protein [Actinomadura meyerae]SNT50279.1 hypothetical protein SAMN05443665_103671 [Actinomadura meyerae]